MLQTFSISTLASCANAFRSLGVSDDEIFFISELKKIFTAGHSIKVRTDLNAKTRTYEVAYDSSSHNGVALLMGGILKKNTDDRIVMANYLDNHELKVTFEISQTDVICIPGPMGLTGAPGKNGITYEEVAEKLLEDKYIFKFTAQPINDLTYRTETLSDKPRFVKIQSDTGEVLVFPEEVLLTLTNIKIENTPTAGIQLSIISEQLSKEFELSFSSLQKARNTLNRICKKYISTKTI